MENFKIELKNLYAQELFEPGRSLAWGHISRFAYPWEALPGIRGLILELGAGLDESEYDRRGEGVWIHKTASVAASVHFGSAVIVGAGAQLRHCANIRENALIGIGAVVGTATELKNSILFDGAEVPHYNYVGDSILGYKAHMGAGAITSNIKSDRTPIIVVCGNERLETGMRKIGAILGDRVEIGCNSVLNPGSVVGAGATVYPLSMVRGFVPPSSIYKRQGEVVRKRQASAG